jgi:hypothetical protein
LVVVPFKVSFLAINAASVVVLPAALAASEGRVEVSGCEIIPL